MGLSDEIYGAVRDALAQHYERNGGERPGGEIYLGEQHWRALLHELWASGPYSGEDFHFMGFPVYRVIAPNFGVRVWLERGDG